MNTDGRAGFAELLGTLRADAGMSLAELGAAAHIARGYIHHLEHGRRWPSRTFAKALDDALKAQGALLDTWAAADELPDWPTPQNPDDRERIALASAHPRRVYDATVSALADVLVAAQLVSVRTFHYRLGIFAPYLVRYFESKLENPCT